jgi:RNA polymerase sigma factor (TIGR02999 family)
MASLPRDEREAPGPGRARPPLQPSDEEWTPLVYAELRSLAARVLRRRSGDVMLQATAIVHEAYLRLCEQKCIDTSGRALFCARAARLIRHIVVDHVRRRRRSRRSAGPESTALEREAWADVERSEDALVALDAGLKALEALDARQSRIAELRFFGGLTVEETASALGLPPRTVDGEWRVARAFLESRAAGR